MSRPVTVNSDDLATLLMVSGVIKNLERAMAGVDRDTDRAVALPGYEAAHQRLNAALNATMREDREAQVELRPDDEQILIAWPMIGNDPGEMDSDLPDVIAIDAARFWKEKPRYDRLAAKGLVDFGNKIDGVKWGRNAAIEWQLEPSAYMVCLTLKGIAARKELKDRHEQ